MTDEVGSPAPARYLGVFLLALIVVGNLYFSRSDASHSAQHWAHVILQSISSALLASALIFTRPRRILLGGAIAFSALNLILRIAV